MIKLDRKIVHPRISHTTKESLVLYEPNIMDKVLEPIEVFLNGKPVKIVNPQRDISVLFKQEKLNGFNVDSIVNYFRNNESNDQLVELRKKCSDEQLIQLCKSRFVQTPTEIQMYFDYLESSFDSEVKRLASLQMSESIDESKEDDNKGAE